jgi:hypothetical protein
VNPASSALTFVALSRDQANQPDSILPRSPGIIFETLVELLFRVAISRFLFSKNLTALRPQSWRQKIRLNLLGGVFNNPYSATNLSLSTSDNYRY